VASVAGSAGSSTVAWTSLGDTTGDTNLDTVLNQMSFDGGTHTITLYNLTPGGQYAVQLFALDTRAIGEGRLNNFQDPNNAADVSQTFDMSAADYVIGTFTATGSTAVIRQNLLVGGAGNLNALVVRGLSSSAPIFSTTPSSVTVYAGRTVYLSGAAVGIPNPAYQWQDGSGNNLVNGGQLSGVTSNTLTIANVTLGNSGSQYLLIATNSAGSTPSSVVTLTVISDPPLSGAYSTNVLALNPVAYWPLNDNGMAPYLGGSPLYDASTNQHDGVYLSEAQNGTPGDSGIVGPQPTDGYPQFAVGQGALEPTFGTANSWANTPALNLNTNTVTIVMWLNPNGAQSPSTGLLVNRNAGTVAGMTYDGVTGTQLSYVWNNNSATTYGYTNGPVIPQNMWSFVALVVTPTNASFYVFNTNGVSTTTFTNNHNNMTWNGSSANIYLGADSQTSRIFNGVIDEPAVFNSALTSNQIYSLTVTNAIVAPVNTNAATLHFGFAMMGSPGSQSMSFSWAPDHQGWQLYTNAVGLTAAGSWFPVTGSASVTNESISINPAQPNVFFQLRYP
jgi:hypothetical protein